MSEIKDSLGLENVGIIKRNLDVDTLIKDAVEKEGAKISSTGATGAGVATGVTWISAFPSAIVTLNFWPSTTTV